MMFHYHLTFGAPWYLALLALLPALWWWSYPRLAELGKGRRLAALGLRTLVLTLFVLALAETQMSRASDRLTVIYLLDQSLSIPAERRRAMVEYVNAAIGKHRKPTDRAGVIVFGRDAAIEIPPFDHDVRVSTAIESQFDPEYTNLAAAMKLAQASFPEDAAKRVVLVSDGNQNQGNALEQAQALAASGIGIDVAPIRYQVDAEVSVERVALPGDIRRGQPFDLRIVVNNAAEPRPGYTGDVRGRLVLSQLIDDQSLVLSEETVTVPPGKRVFTVRQRIDKPNFYTYEARFVPERSSDDAIPQNNRATAFTHVQGKGQVLLIEDVEQRGEHDLLVDRLRRQGLEVTVRNTSQLFSSLGELQAYDTVVLANVPRSTNENVSFSDEQIDMLVRNTQQMGAGLVMLGGPSSFGAGGWNGTELEKAMPVDFEIKNAEVVPHGALMMVLDKSGSMAGQKMELSKAAAVEAAKVLARHDQVGVVAFDVEAHTVVPMQRGGDAKAVARRIHRLAGSGGTNMEPGMVAGYQALQGVDAAIKHMILLTDGMTTGTGYPALAAQMRQENMTVSCVAVGGDADKNLMQDIAATGGGKCYNVASPKAIPRIFQREARRVSRPLIYEDKSGFRLQVKSAHEMLSGIDELPPITGFVLSTRKENPLVEVALVSSKPASEENNTVLAAWTYGLGKTVALATDAGARWTKDWPGQAVYDKLFGQAIRWSMRPAGTAGRFTTSFEHTGGQVRVVVAALDQNDEFRNYLTLTGTVVGPDLKTPIAMKIEQTAPGRYVGTFPARDAGSYFLTIDPGEKMAPIRTGVNVPYSDEFRDRAANDTLLAQLAAAMPKDAPAGQVIEAREGEEGIESLLAIDAFRHDLPKSKSSQEIWYLLVLAASCVFFGDVLVRRVHVHFAWVSPLAARVRDIVLRRQPAPVKPEYIERLRNRKAEVDDHLEQLRAANRFEAMSETPMNLDALDEGRAAAPVAPVQSAGPSITAEKEEETYTERLLKAKKKAWEGRDR